MKKLLLSALLGLSATTLLSGCLVLHVGGGTTSKAERPTLGQQLLDLHTARETGAISDSEYETEKAKLLRKN